MSNSIQISSNTKSIFLSEFTLIILVILSNSSMVGIVSFENTENLFLSEISLSSILPLVELLLSILLLHCCSGQSRKRTPSKLALSPNTSKNPNKFSLFLGKPSTIYIFC